MTIPSQPAKISLALFLLVASVPAGGRAKDSPKLHDFAGTWVLKFARRNFLVLSLHVNSGAISGSLVRPKHFQYNNDGEFSHISIEHIKVPVIETSADNGDLDLTTKEAGHPDKFVMRLTGLNHATLKLLNITLPVPPWHLERAHTTNVVVASDWPGAKPASKEIADLQKKLREMVIKDQAIRTTKRISDKKIQEVTDEDRAEVLRIHQKYGWPKISLVGAEASNDYWLLVQHQDLDVQKAILPDLKRAMEKGEASRLNFAYLYDRVMVREGKPQYWGTQAHCVNGKAQLDPVRDRAGLEERRKSLCLQPIQPYLQGLNTFCSREVKDLPPTHQHH